MAVTSIETRTRVRKLAFAGLVLPIAAVLCWGCELFIWPTIYNWFVIRPRIERLAQEDVTATKLSQRIKNALVAIGQPAIPALVVYIQQAQEPFDRRAYAAAYVLKEIGTIAVPSLVAVLKDRSQTGLAR